VRSAPGIFCHNVRHYIPVLIFVKKFRIFVLVFGAVKLDF